jgi:hypothetical protein
MSIVWHTRGESASPQPSSLPFPFLIEGSGGGFCSLASVKNHPDGDAVAGYGVKGGLGGEGDHCLEVLCGLPLDQ